MLILLILFLIFIFGVFRSTKKTKISHNIELTPSLDPNIVKGEYTIYTDQGPEVFILRDKKYMSELINSAKSFNFSIFSDFLAENKAFIIKNNTKIKIVEIDNDDRNIKMKKIIILEGDKKGETGWVEDTFLIITPCNKN